MLFRLFGLDPKETTVRTEILAGVTTFLTMSYILAVNPSIMGETGMDKGALFTTTVLVSVIATMVMAFLAKLPFGLAPGMGLNAFFAYTVCLSMGYSWQFALTAVFIEGIIFILLTITNLREVIVNAIPASLRSAIGAGIGLFIAFIGLKGGGIIVSSSATLVTLGDITSGTALLAVIGIVITGVMVILKVPGALLIGILGTTLIGIPMSITQYGGVVSVPPSITPIFWQLELDPSRIFSLDMLAVVFTFLFVDIFDTIGTLVSVALKAGLVGKDGRVRNINKAFMADAVGTTAGAVLGSSTVTTYVESAAGVAQGGRSGLTAFVVAVCFAISLLFAPVFMAIPGAATCPVLVIVGLFMLSSIRNIDLDEFSESIPAFICILLIPMTYSISDGILIGLIGYVLLNMLCGKFYKLTPAMYILAVLFILKYVFI
ncbi:MAG: NCS2 family permease [Tannerella sp.]|nr:NCS2 family permease [Tannerella sp.]